MTLHLTTDSLIPFEAANLNGEPSQPDEGAASKAKLLVHGADEAPLTIGFSVGIDRIFICFGVASLSLPPGELKIGECLLVPNSSSEASYHAAGDFVMVEVSCHLRLGVGFATPFSASKRIRGRSACFSALAEAARRHTHHDPAGLQSYAEAFAILGLAELQALHSRSEHEPELPKWHMKTIDAYLDNNLDQPLKITDLADLCDYSTAHFSRLFKARTGKTPHRYILERRVDAACAQLQTGDNSISDVAYGAGFSSQSHMTSTFRQIIGRTPNEVRSSKEVSMQEIVSD